MLSDEDERMSVGSRGSVRRNGYDDDYSVMSSRSSRLSDESRVSRASRLDLTSSRLSDDSRVSRASRLDLQPSSYASSDLYSLNGLSSSRNPGSTFNGYQPLEYTSYRSSGSRASSRASSARASPVVSPHSTDTLLPASGFKDNCGSVASFLRSAASSSGLPRDLDDVTIPDFSDVSRFAPAGGRGYEVEDRDYLEKGSRAASALTAATLTSLGGTSSRRGSGDTAITADTETSIREIKDALVEVEEKYRKAMVSNAQLDNEKNNLMYQVDTLKDSLMELEELLSESRREYEEKVKEFEREKHAHSVLQFQFNEMKETLKQSEELLNEIRQLRLKQDGFVREISDLQETVEWKDKKIGALERQKEYTDAIRTERDELREEVVKLKDILKKHGIVLGPDLNVNGDIGGAEVDGSTGGDSAQQPAQDSQTPPTEGNSMLGNTEETQLRRSGEEEVDPEQQKEMLKEEAKENQLNSDTSCNDTDVSTVEKLSEEQPAEEQQTCLPMEGNGIEENGLNADSNDQSITEAKDIIVCSAEPQEVAISAEDNVQETERMPEGGDSGETSHPDLEETESKSSDEIRETCNKVGEEQEHKQTDAEESDLRNTEECPQQDVSMGVVEVNVPQETTPAVSNTDSQQEPENTEEAENDDAEEIVGKSQSTTASGKKKKRKRRGKKKGNQQKDNTEQDNGKTEKDVQVAKTDNGSATEPETLKEPNTSQVEKEQEKKETEEVDTAKAVEPTEATSHKDTLKEQRKDHVTNEHDKELTLEVETVEEIKEVASEETHSHTEITVDCVTDEQNKEQSSETEPVESVEAVKPSETSAHVETVIDSGTEPAKDNEQTLETSPPEDNVSTSDCFDKECTHGADNAESASIATNDDDFRKASDIVDCVGDEVGSVNKMKPECTVDHPENNLEPNSDENTDLPNSDDAHVDVSESTNKSSEREELTSASQPHADDFTDHLSSSVSQPSSELSASTDTGVKEEAEAVEDEKELKIETEQECVAHTAVSLSHDGGESELETDGLQQEEECADVKEPEPDSSSYEETSNSCTGASLMNNTDVLVTEESLLKTEVLVEPIDDVVSQTEQTADSEISLETAEVNTSDALNTPDPPQDATEAGSSVEQDLSTEDTAVAEDPEQKLSENDQQPESSPSLTEQLPESSEDKSEEDSPQPNQQGSDEEDDEDEEGQSFDFDDMDVEAAVATEHPKNQDQVEAEEAVEVGTCESSSQPCQSKSETEENTQNKPVESSNNDGNQVDALGEESDSVPQDKQDSLTHEEAAADGTKALSIGEGGVVAENINQDTPVPVEEGLDAVLHELQSDDLVLPKTTEQVAGNKEPAQSGKDMKKNGKKGKGKGKEE
ncbi:hypothetical protein INR49_026772 [Caranx melampygus]|nr:hypothetical protein INR49_026772 [Caranx melampygus]